MLNLNLIILEVNPFTALTEESIRKNMPGIGYTIARVSPKGILNTALDVADGKISFVVMSGVVLDIKDGDLPPLSVIKQYHLCAARNQVYADHEQLSRFYNYLDRPANKKELGLDVFIINPAMWDNIPDKDAGALKDKKLLSMPRYMNHKTDELIDTCVSSYEALKYGMLGQQAAVHNYRSCLEKGSASVIERYAYCFEKLSPYLGALAEKERQICQDLIDRSTKINMRAKLAVALGYRR